jgi:hypothetical protein
VIGATGDAIDVEVRPAVDAGFSQTLVSSPDRGPNAQRAARAVTALARYGLADAREHEARAARAEARAAILSYVEHLRAESVAPERALTLVKMVVQRPASSMAIHAREALFADIVDWFLDGYYRPHLHAAD